MARQVENCLTTAFPSDSAQVSIGFLAEHLARGPSKFESFYDVERLRTANANHRAITTAILKLDAATAERHMRRHVEEGIMTLSGIARESSQGR